MLHILVGPISSGKSSYCQNVLKNCDYYIVCNDDSIVTAVHGGVYSAYTKELKPLYKSIENTIVLQGLSKGYEVLVDRGVNISRKSRRRFIGLAHSLDEGVVAVVFPKEAAEIHALRRFNSDPRGLSLEHWQKAAARHAAEWEDPSKEEGFDDVYYITWEQIKRGDYY